MERSIFHGQHVQMTQERRQQIENFKYKYKLMLTMKWEILKQKKREFVKDALQRADQKHNARIWIKYAKALVIFKKVNDAFTLVRYKKFIQSIKRQSANRILNLFLRFRKKLYPQEKINMTKHYGIGTVYPLLMARRSFRNKLTFSNCLMHGNTVAKAKNVLYQFLKRMRGIDSLMKNLI